MTTLTCLSCGTTQPSKQKFCGECGSSLPRSCPGCGASVGATQKFCAECGLALHPAETGAGSTPAVETTLAAQPPKVAPSPAIEEERRLVTALFCDLVGFTPLSESLDPEEVRDIQAAYFAAMSDQIARYGGTVEKYAGDAVLALFGAPVAHEDDAERAVLCALGMQAAIELVALDARTKWQVEPAIRVGVNTGEVVAGAWNASGRQDVAVTGDALNSAARIQAVAEPGEVLAGAETMRLTRRRIRYGERRDVSLKGKIGTVPVWPAAGVRQEFGERWEGYETPLVGRDREMLLLLDAWVRVQAGEGQLVTLVGDAGVGKSRLAADFLNNIATAASVRVIRARCLSYGQDISLWLLADLLRSLFGIKEQDSLDEVGVTIQTAIPALLSTADDGSREEALDVLGDVLGLPPRPSPVLRAGPQIRRQALIRGVRAVLGALAARTPVVVVLEDLHWIDDASREVLREVLGEVLGLRMLVIAAQRPGWTAPWSEWGWPERLTLRPLRDEDATMLAEAVLGGALSRQLQQYVRERAGGNPFFLEEMLRSLVETGGVVREGGEMVLAPEAAERLPSTLTEVLLARLDRLDGPSRQAAQIGSVIGRTFGATLLAEVAGLEQEALEAPLATLQQAEIAFSRRNPELEYVFKHVSMRDVAYNTLVQRRRQELHLRVARAIAALYPTDEYAEVIAYHYGRTEAPEAAEWLERAGDRAAAVYANEAAIGHYAEARRRSAGAGTAVQARLDEKLGSVQIVVDRYDEALVTLESAVSTYGEIRDLESAGRVVAQIGMAHRYRGTPQLGIERVVALIDLLARSGPSESLAALYIALAQLYFLTGRYHDVQEAAQKAAEIARATGNERLLGDAEERRAAGMTMCGEAEGARRVLEAAIPLIERGGDQLALARALNNLGEEAKLSGEIGVARRHLQRALAVAERAGNLNLASFLLGSLSEILLVEGDWVAAQENTERAVAMSEAEGRSASLGVPLVTTGQICLYRGRLDEAGVRLGRSLAISEEIGDRQLTEHASVLLAELDIARGEPRSAVARLERMLEGEHPGFGFILPVMARACLALGETQRALSLATEAVEQTRGRRVVLLAEALCVLAACLIRECRTAEARAVLGEVLALAKGIPYPYVEARALVEAGALARLEGNEASALEHLGEALAIFERLGASKDAEWARRMLDGFPGPPHLSKQE